LHTTNRRTAVIAIVLGALALLCLSACAKPNDSFAAARPTAGVPAAAAVLAAATEPSAATATATPAGEVAGTLPAANATGTTTLTQTAAMATPTALGETDPFTGTDVLTSTEDITVTVEITTTGTLTVTHPVAIAIADYFTVPVLEIITLHADGLGFGEIARAYFLARELAADGDPTNDLAAAQILGMHQSGMGWGVIVASLDLPHGNSGRNLGLIMRRHQEQPVATIVVVSTDVESDDRGPHAMPPGQLKDKDKPHNNDHGNGNGNGKGNGSGGGGKKGK
jgi:hypothetical protein